MTFVAWLFLAPFVVLEVFAHHRGSTCNLVETAPFNTVVHCWCPDDNFEIDGWVA